MSCIVGLEHGGRVYMAADGQSTDAWHTTLECCGGKLARVGPFLIATAGASRMRQLVQHSPELHQLSLPPEAWPCANPHAFAIVEGFMVRTVVPLVREVLRAGGQLERKDDVERLDGALMFGVGSYLFTMHATFEVLRVRWDTPAGPTFYSALGTGDDVARGVLWTLFRCGAEARPEPVYAVRSAVEAAAAMKSTVGFPIAVGWTEQSDEDHEEAHA